MSLDQRLSSVAAATELHTAYTRCDLCGSDDAVEILPSTIGQDAPGDWRAYACTSGGYGRHNAIVRCRQCGLVYQNPRPHDGAMLEIYEAVKDPLYVEEREGRILTFEHHLKPMERHTGAARGRRLLDIGAYTGVFVDIAGQHGWDAWGVEPSAWAAEEAQRQGLHLVQGTLDSANFAEEHFSVITMWDVIEHVTNPLETVRAAARLLEPGGHLVVHTMDLDSLFARLMGRRWPWFMEMHLTYFTRATLRRLLDQAGFSVEWMGAQGRYLQAGYLASRVTALQPLLGRPLEYVVTRLGLRHLPLRINLGDLFTTYARKA